MPAFPASRRLLPLLLWMPLLLVGCGDRTAAAGEDHPAAAAVADGDDAAAAPLLDALRQQLDGHRRIIVLLADEAAQSAPDRATSTGIGQQLFHEGLERQQVIADRFDALLRSPDPRRFATLGHVLDYIESAPELYDADRLAFREVLRDLHERVGADSSLPAVKLHQRIGDDLDALDGIERHYDQEITRIFSRFDRTRAIVPKREKWDDYVAHLRSLYSREAILRDHGVIEPYPMSMQDSEREIFGRDLPRKTVVLTFDDGPHRVHTDEITAILKRYDVPGVFFQVGRNVGTIGEDGTPTLGPMAGISRQLMADGYAVGNHSQTHAQLSRTSGDALRHQVLDADALLRQVGERRAPLFRFPYGARNAEGLQLLGEAGLKSIMWNIDSMDWADPVPESIVQRVLAQVEKEQRGIILFHDIHDRAVKALPQILDRLIADGYQFAGWNGREFTVSRPRAGTAAEAASTVTTGYENSWAIVVGIDEYTHWPRLEYASRDAQAVADTLTGQFGFPSSQVIVLKNQQATRNNILAAFHDRLADERTGKNDRVFVFFAGHGATRRLASGRDLGYIIPVDSDPDEFATDAIAMTDIQNIAESLRAKHVLFVMDACYSGLGLTRGGPASSAFLRENARRSARQMLTAGGADQPVADGGPNGHSVFTWVLLQALSGKGDLNGDGLITGTELAAYVAPAVSAVSQQTPAFGSLPGSQGGEFVFQVPDSQEFLNADTAQLPADAIALNSRVDAAQGDGDAPVRVTDLLGGSSTLVVPTAVKASDRQRAQQANDRGLQLYREKRYDEAVAQFTEALKLRPDFAQAANNLGFVYYRQQRYAEAARWLENTLKIDPSRAVAHLNLGDAYLHGGDTAKAKQAYTTYLALQPQGSGAEQARAQLRKLQP